MMKPTWEHLPFHFKQDLVEFLDYKTRKNLRKCSKADQILVDSCPMVIHKFAFFIAKNQDSLYFTPESRTDTKHSDTDKKSSFGELLQKFVKQFFHRKTLIEELTIEFSDVEKSRLLVEEIEKSQESKNKTYKINAKKLLWYSCHSNPYAVKFIEYLNPGTLKSMRFGRMSESLELMNKLMETRQWKSSKELILNSFLPIGVDILKFLHAERFKIQILEEEFEVEKMQNVILKYLEYNHPVGSSFSITTDKVPQEEDGETEYLENYKPMMVNGKKIMCNRITILGIPSSANFLFIQRSLIGFSGLVRDNDLPVPISIAWSANSLFIDYFYFAPSLVVRIDGILTMWINSHNAYLISYATYGLSMASSQLIFCNRVFLIMNMYKGIRTVRQIILEVIVYIFVGLMPLSTIPVVWELTPDQKKSKNAIIQAIVVFFFANFPILVANLLLLIDLEIAWPSYVIDYLRENQPNASLLTLFLFYDPYQLYMRTTWKYYKGRFSSRIMRVKSAHPSEVRMVEVRF
ncbi:unnamed protein product [Caenorhabditis brenneri]